GARAALEHHVRGGCMTSSQGPAGTRGAASGPRCSRQGGMTRVDVSVARQASVFSRLFWQLAAGQYGHGQAGTDWSSAVASFFAAVSLAWTDRQQQHMSPVSTPAEPPEQQQEQACAPSLD